MSGIGCCTATMAATPTALTVVEAPAPSKRMMPVDTGRVMVQRSRLTGSELDKVVPSTPTVAALGKSITTWSVATAPGASPNGAGATLSASGVIDQTQLYANITTNYAMKYVDCANGGPKMTYDVRWNVMSVSTNTSTRLITASARLLNSPAGRLGNQFFALPVNLRGIGGP